MRGARAWPIFLLVALRPALAQETGTVSGRVLDASTGARVATAAVRVVGTVVSTFADDSGRFTIRVPAGARRLVAERIGYAPGGLELEVPAGGVVTVEIVLEPQAVALGSIVVAATKRESTSLQSPVSVTVLAEEEIRERVPNTVADAVAYVPSAQFVGEQLNLRGSSGYARGTGSRVLLLIDGVPGNAGDSGGINWDLLPLTEVARVEVVKGAGSALYGTSALGGVVNVVSAAPPAEPLTRLRLRGGLHDNPPHSSWDWSEQAAGFVSAELSHGRRFGPFGFWARAGQWHDDGYRENGDLDRTNVAAQLQLEAGADTLGLFGAWARERYGASLLWCMRGECDDPEQLAFQPFKVPETARNDRTRSDKSRAHLTHRRRWNESFSSFERLSYQRNDWLTDFGADSVGSVANVYGAEVQVGWQTTSRLFVTAGSEAAYTDVEANLFGSHDQTIIALYGQGELGIAPWLTLTAGARLDVVLVDGGSLADPFSSQLSPRLGVVLEPDAVTRVRASVGRGFRAPTVAELFTATEVGGFLVIPNPDLKPERSLAGELGAQRLISSWLAVDVAGFMYWLKDYIEADTVSGGAGTIEIRFDNLREARIAGVEAIALLSLVRDRLRAQLAYTYLHTEDETTGEPLAYRPTHMVTASGALRLGRLELGADYRYASAFDAVKVFTDERTDPIVALNVLDLRAAYRIGRQTVRFVVDNSLNYAYTTIERNMAPTRRYTLAAELEF